MIQAEIGGDGFKPAARRRTAAQVAEAFVGAQEHFLGDVFGFGLIGEQAHSRAKHHVLVVPHKRLEMLRIGHGRDVTLRGGFYTRDAPEHKTLA